MDGGTNLLTLFFIAIRLKISGAGDMEKFKKRHKVKGNTRVKTGGPNLRPLTVNAGAGGNKSRLPLRLLDHTVSNVLLVPTQQIDWGLTLFGIPQTWKLSAGEGVNVAIIDLSLIHISEPTRLGMISYAVFC